MTGRKHSIWLDAAISVSCGCFAWLDTVWIYGNLWTGTPYGLIVAIIGVIAGISCFAVLRLLSGRLDIEPAPTSYLVTLSFLAMYTAVRYYSRAGSLSERYGTIDLKIYAVLAGCSVLFLTVFFLVSYRILARLLGMLLDAGLDRVEWLFLILGLWAAVNFSTCAFVAYPVLHDGERYGGVLTDVIYLFDSLYHLKLDSFFLIGGVENDIRNIFFGLFQLPVSAPCHMISQLTEAIWGIESYPYLIAWSQGLAIVGAAILLSRCAVEGPHQKIGFLLLFSCSYMAMLHVLILEQYAWPLFWSSAFVYLACHGKTGSGLDACYILGAGNLVSNALIAGPMVFHDRKRFKKLFEISFVVATGLLLVSGQLSGILRTFQMMPTTAMFFGSNLTIANKVMQFSTFVRSVFIQPSVKAFSVTPWYVAEIDQYAAYRLSDEFNFDWIGILILVLCAVSFIWNRKDRFMQYAGGWVLVSIFILLCLGWGTHENGLVIYGLHFGWAYIALIYKLIERLFVRHRKILLGACCAVSGIMLWQNVQGLSVLFDFLGKYYPS